MGSFREINFSASAGPPKDRNTPTKSRARDNRVKEPSKEVPEGSAAKNSHLLSASCCAGCSLGLIVQSRRQAHNE